MSKRIDLTGQRFGRLTVESFLYMDKNRHSMWICKCDCGKTKIVQSNNLKSGHTKSCGCLYEEVNVKHRKHGTRLYRIWRGMVTRTENKGDKRFCDYGGRGIRICEEWRKDFQKFYDWAMSHGYDKNLTIDRIDNDKGYYPDNCRWADRKTQSNNRRYNVRIKYQGEQHTLSQWSEKLGIAEGTLWNRLYLRCWTVEEAFETQVGQRRKK